MAKNLLHMLGELFGIKNFAPPTLDTASFSLDGDGHKYTLDAKLSEDKLALCLSRLLLPHEANNENLLSAAAQIAAEHEGIKAYYKDNIISFVQQIPQDASLVVLEKSLDDCIKCQEHLKRGTWQ